MFTNIVIYLVKTKNLKWKIRQPSETQNKRPAAGKRTGESALQVGKVKFPLYFCPRRDGRVVDRGGLENR